VEGRRGGAPWEGRGGEGREGEGGNGGGIVVVIFR